jgi:hypothetical protein
MDNLSLTVNGTSRLLIDALKYLDDSADRINFTSLMDTPPDYTGHAGKLVAVKATEDGTEFIDVPSDDPVALTDLTDTPVNYIGHAGKLVAVKATEDGTEFIDAPLGGDLVDSVFGRIGSVVAQAGDYTADDITETDSRKIMTAHERDKLAGMEARATGDQSAAEIESAYNSKVGRVSVSEITAGTETDTRRFSPEDIASMARTHGGASLFTALADTPASLKGKAGKFVAVTPSEDALEFVGAPSGTGSFTTVANQAELTTSTERSNLVYMKAYHGNDDSGGGWFEARESGASVDHGHVMAHGSGGKWRFHRLGVNVGIANVCHFGAYASGNASHATGNTRAFQRAIDYLAALSGVKYIAGYTLEIPRGVGEYFIDGELTVPSTIASLQIKGIGKPTIMQNKNNTGIFIFTINAAIGNAGLHRHILVEEVIFQWSNWQTASNARSNALCLTNRPYWSSTGTEDRGHTFGFVVRHCMFRHGFRAFTTMPTSEADGWIAGGFVQSVVIEHCGVEHMSGAIYYMNDSAKGGPQLTIRNITTHYGYTYGGTRRKVLEETAIYVQGAQNVILDQIEFLGEDRELVYFGTVQIAKISNISVENWNLEDANWLFKLNSSLANVVVENVYWQNSAISSTKSMVCSYSSKVRLMGAYYVRTITQTGGAFLFVTTVQKGGKGKILWDGIAAFDNTTNRAVVDGASSTALWRDEVAFTVT